MRDAIAKQTLGQLLRDIKRKLLLPDDLEPLFDSALSTRNRLMHQFFPMHGVSLFYSAGRDLMVEDLKQMLAELSKAFSIARDIAKKLAPPNRSDDPP